MTQSVTTPKPDDAAYGAPGGDRLRIAFVDGTMRTEARLTRTGPDGDVSMGLAGSWAAGAVLVDGGGPARSDRVGDGGVAIFTGGRPVPLPDDRAGWRWEPYAVDGVDVEADIAEVLSNEGRLTVLDGPLRGIRHRYGLPVVGYVKMRTTAACSPASGVSQK